MKPRFKTALARRGALLIIAAAGIAAAGGAQAAGTTAGTTISNKATLNFSVGGVAQPAIASSPTGSSNGTGANTDFLVDNKISHTVVTTNASAVSVIPGQTAVALAFTVTNTGNFTQDYALSFANLASGQTVFTAGNLVTDNFDVSSGTCVIKVNGATQNYVGSLAPDASVPVTVTCNIPSTQVNNDVSGLSLTATAATAGSSGATLVTQTSGADTSGVDVVFADAAGSDDSARDGKSSARSAFKVSSAVLAVSKTVVAVCDPFNGNTNPKNIPGAYVQYTVTIANSASGTNSATLTTVTDVLSGSVTFDPDMISGAGAGTNCAAGVSPTSAAGSGFKVTTASRAGFPKFYTSANDSDGATFSGGTITVDFSTVLNSDGTHAAGELKPGESLTLVYQVNIN
jgi:hypothetical protein